MPVLRRRIDPEVRSRTLRLPETRGQDYPALTAGTAAIAKQVGHETVHRWAVQVQIDGGTRAGTTKEKSVGINRLKAENKQCARTSPSSKQRNLSSRGNSIHATDNHWFHSFTARLRFRGLADPPGPA